MKNYAKKVLMILLALLPCFVVPAMADPIDPDNIPITPFPKPGNGGTRPRVMARFPRSVESLPECYYYNGVVSVVADSGILFINASVTRLDDGEVWSKLSIGNRLSLGISDEPGTYLLVITLSNGNSYYGEFTLE